MGQRKFHQLEKFRAMKDTVKGCNVCWIRVLEGKKGIEIILEKNCLNGIVF